MHIGAPMLKHSVRSSSRDNSTFIKRKYVTTLILIFPLLMRGAETKGINKKFLLKKK